MVLLFIFTGFFSLAQNYSTHFQKLKGFDSGLSAQIVNAQTGEVLYQHNANRPLIPASVTKLFTAASVLKHLPPGTQMSTELCWHEPTGELSIVGAGDPGFVSESLWFLVNEFRRTSINTIKDIVVDDQIFDRQRFDETRQKERVDRAYDAPVGAMSFNWNSINVHVRPGKKPGEPATVLLDPMSGYATLSAQVTTVKGSTTKSEIAIDRQERESGDHFVVRGKIGLRNPELTLFASVSKPDLWAGEQLKNFLQERGIAVQGKVIARKKSSACQTVASQASKPIELMVKDMNKFSNNFVSEMLVKLLDHRSQMRTGTIAGGTKILSEDIKEWGVADTEAKIVNPSGLSRENRISAQALVRLQREVFKDLRLFPEFIAALPIAGVDGTLRNRMKDEKTSRWVRAKTGYLNGVVSLAGYAGTASGKVLTFAFIYNGNDDEAKVRAIFDQVLKEVL